jgi:hypothetical protein
VDIHCKNLFTGHDIKNMTIRNTTIKSQDSLISILDGRNVVFDRVRFQVPGGEVVTSITGPLSEDIRFEHSRPEKPRDWEKTSWSRRK